MRTRFDILSFRGATDQISWTSILLKGKYCSINIYKDYANIRKNIYLKKSTETSYLIRLIFYSNTLLTGVY